MRISDCSSDVCSSYLNHRVLGGKTHHSAADSKIQKFVAFLPKREEHFSKPHHTIWSNLSEQRLFNAYRSRGSPLDRSTGRGLRSAEERSEERRVGKEWVSTVRYRWGPYD